MRYLLIAFLCCSLLLNFNSKQVGVQSNEIRNDEVQMNISLNDSIFNTDENLLVIEYEIINQSSKTLQAFTAIHQL